MKYIIFEGNGLVHPVLFADHTTHLQVGVKGAKAVSAGFVSFDSCQLAHCDGRSDSLNLDNRGLLDERIIDKWRRNSGTDLFLADFNQPSEVLQKEITMNDLCGCRQAQRVMNCLKANNVKTVGDLARLTKRDLLKFRNFGKECLHDLQRAMSVWGVKFKDE